MSKRLQVFTEEQEEEVVANASVPSNLLAQCRLRVAPFIPTFEQWLHLKNVFAEKFNFKMNKLDALFPNAKSGEINKWINRGYNLIAVEFVRDYISWYNINPRRRHFVVFYADDGEEWSKKTKSMCLDAWVEHIYWEVEDIEDVTKEKLKEGLRKEISELMTPIFKKWKAIQKAKEKESTPMEEEDSASAPADEVEQEY